jgi:hypothetical protein
MLLAHAAGAPLHWLRVCNRVLSGEAETDSQSAPPPVDEDQHDGASLSLAADLPCADMVCVRLSHPPQP